MSKYPRVTDIQKRPKNTCAKCFYCEEIAKFKTTIQVNWFRGDDDVIWTCDLHKKSLDVAKES